MNEQMKCIDKVKNASANRTDDIRRLLDEEYKGNEEGLEDIGTLNEYGLDFGYVAPGTFTDQERGYFRYQISWGGPSEEYRFYVDNDLTPYKVEFWYLDWFDGAPHVMRGKDLDTMLEVFDYFGGADLQYMIDKELEE